MAVTEVGSRPLAKEHLVPPLQCRSDRPSPATLDTYLREINQTSLLNAQEESDLAYRVEEGDHAARDHMVRANLRLVVNIARSYIGKGLPLDDLIAEGNLGLLRAVEGFDPSLKHRFSTYASYWIHQSIKRAVVNTGKTVRIPTYMFDLLSKWRRATAQLQEELGRAPTPDEIAARLNLPKKKLTIIKAALRVYNAGLQNEQSDSPWPLADLLSDERTPTPELCLMQADEMQQILHLLDRLDEREATVLRLRFGLNTQEPLTLKEIGDRLNLTRERVRQIERHALKKLRNLLPLE